MLEAMGISTGTDLGLLLEARAITIMEGRLDGEPAHGQYPKSGQPLGLRMSPPG